MIFRRASGASTRNVRRSKLNPWMRVRALGRPIRDENPADNITTCSVGRVTAFIGLSCALGILLANRGEAFPPQGAMSRLPLENCKFIPVWSSH